MLKKEGREIYNNLSSYLKSHKKFEMLDDYTITELAMYFQIFFDSARVVEKQGAIQVFKGGATNVSGEFTAMIRASKNIRDICTRTGIYEMMKSKFREYGQLTDHVMTRVK